MRNKHIFAFNGAAADLTIPLPFTPTHVEMYRATVGGSIEHGVKTNMMSGSAYLSTSTGIDAGVTIADHSLTIANGADINGNGYVTHGVAWE